jgi:hypothetical protein
MDEIKIRPLKRKDRKTLTDLLRKLADKIGANGITNLIVSDASGDRQDGATADNKVKMDVFTRTGVELLKQMLDLLEEDVALWFADLAGLKKEELDDAPFDFEANVIDQIVSSKEIGDFFTHAWRAYSAMKTYAGQAKMEKAK